MKCESECRVENRAYFDLIRGGGGGEDDDHDHNYDHVSSWWVMISYTNQTSLKIVKTCRKIFISCLFRPVVKKYELYGL